MGEFYTFPHIESLARRPEVFALGAVVALEKVDGTNARFGFVDGVFKIGSRNQEIGSEDPFGFAAWVRAQGIERRLVDHPDTIIYGEWYGRKIQKGVAYSTGRNFRGFAVRVGRAFLPVDEALAFIHALGLESTPVLYRGAPDPRALDALRILPSATAHLHALSGEELGVDLAQNYHEGVVLWPTYPFMNAHGDWVIAKHKNPSFAETRSAQKNQTPTGDLATAAAFVEEYATAERYRHVIATLRADGVDVESPQAIGLILRTFNQDVVREGAPEYDQLDKDTQKQVNKLLNAFAKQQLEGVHRAA